MVTARRSMVLMAVLLGGTLVLPSCGKADDAARAPESPPAEPPLPAPEPPPTEEVARVDVPREEARIEFDGPHFNQPESATLPPPTASVDAPSAGPTAPVSERTPESFPAKERKIDVFYATNRQLLDVTVLTYVKILKWPLAALALTLLSVWPLRRVLAANARWLASLVTVAGILATLWLGWSAVGEAVRLRQYKQRVGRVHGNAILPGRDWPLETGIATVGFHKNHKPGGLERPSWKTLTLFEDPDQHVVVDSVAALEKAPYFQALSASLARPEPHRNEAFVFVHGYNTTFEEAVLRTGQIGFDLGFPGVPICFSWASYGGLEDYWPDEEHARTSAFHLQRFLEALVAEARPARLHLVVHSMGSRVVYDALRDIAPTSPLAGFRFDELVLAAPDIGVEEFETSALLKLLGCCSKATLYASDGDSALKASTEVHKKRRAGQAGATLVVAEGLETIDVTKASRGHSYIGEDGRVIRDLGALIIGQRRAADRGSHLLKLPRIRTPPLPDLCYWELVPSR